MAWLLLLWNRAFATPIELPPGEDRAAWVNPLALSGLGSEAPDDGTMIRFTPSPSGWTLWVRDVDGAEHRVVVAAPTTRADRESLAALAASLAHPVAVPNVALPQLPPLPEPVPKPIARPPRPVPVDPPPSPVAVVVPEPVVEPEPVALVPEPEPPAVARAPDLELDPPVIGVRPPSATTPWVGGGPSLRMRPSVRSTVAGGVWVGVARGLWRAGTGIEVAAPATLLEVEVDRRMTVADLRVVVVWAPGQWELGPVGDASIRAFTRGSVPYVVPVGGVVLARRIPVGAVAVRIALLVERDLVPLKVWVGDADPILLEPLSAGLGVSLWSR